MPIMNTQHKEMADAFAALSDAERARLERLAALGERTPEEMLFFVLRDGFAACEASIRAGIQADEDFAAGKGIPHADVMESIRNMLSTHVKRPRKVG